MEPLNEFNESIYKSRELFVDAHELGNVSAACQKASKLEINMVSSFFLLDYC